MERLDFASVMAVLRRNIDEDFCSNQVGLMEVLFRDMNEQYPDGIEFDNGQVCKWMNGLARLSPKIIAHYREHGNQRKLARTIEEQIIPMMPDSAMAVQELYDLLMQAPNVSQQMKTNLTEGFSFEDQNEEAVFITDVLCLAMQVRYEKRDIRSKALSVPVNLSPAVQGYIYDGDMPKPCRWFVGREKELVQLHGLLVDHSKVFVHGIPGIGKSELAKAYVSRHGKEYTNVMYLYYGGDLKRMITDMDFADDRLDESQEVRFQRHDRFLRTLRDDTLLVVDNFNVTASEDSFLDVLLRYRCRILFTTRCRYEDQTTLEVQELHPDTLVELMGKFYNADRKLEIMEEIIALLHGHTFAVELAARLLANSMLSPKALLKKLKKEKAAMDAVDRIRSVKDGTSRKAAAYMSCSQITNEYDGVQHDYTRKRGLVWQQVFLPEYAPAEWSDRAVLWNAVEENEKTKDSRLAREFVVALPIEGDKDGWITLLTEFIQEKVPDSGVRTPSPPGGTATNSLFSGAKPGRTQSISTWNASVQMPGSTIAAMQTGGFWNSPPSTRASPPEPWNGRESPPTAAS